MLKKILLGAAVLLAAFAAFIASRPADFKVERSVVINAPASAAFPWVNDLRKANDWSPWSELDPGMKQSYEGPAAGVGASYAWDGNDKVGSGKQTIVDVKPNELVRVKLEFFKPIAATNSVDFTFVPEGNGTKVSWIMTGRHGFMGKAFSLAMDMDAMVGGDFEKGLAKLKALAEASPAPAKKK
jgi:hypothetical protein